VRTAPLRPTRPAAGVLHTNYTWAFPLLGCTPVRLLAVDAHLHIGKTVVAVHLVFDRECPSSPAQRPASPQSAVSLPPSPQSVSLQQCSGQCWLQG
jgi:hypothetical protein